MKALKFTLDRAIVISILVASSLLTTILTLASIVFEYHNEMNHQRELAASIEKTIAKPMGSLLYNGDEDLTRIYAESILANREIVCITIEDYYAADKEKRWCDDDKKTFQSFELVAPVHFEGFAPDGREQKMANIGRITIEFTDKQIIQGIKERVLTFFGSQALKAFLISFFILYVIRWLVMQHIDSIFLYFREYSVRFKGKPLVLSAKRWTPEFDELVRSINIMVGQQEKIIEVAAEREHYYRQLAKVFFPHQLSRMSAGEQLERTMPVGSGEAVVIAFDLIGSSQMQSPKFKTFLHLLLSACNEAMMKDYDAEKMTASAYRIKVMGDGFLCSVGYPLPVKAGRRAADVAIELATTFMAKTRDLAEELALEDEVYCGIGLAQGMIESFFADTRPSEYDIFGRALIHATRYESCRRLLLEELGVRDSILVVQSKVFALLSPELQQGLVEYPLVTWKVRDDAEADRLYYRLGRGQARQIPAVAG